MVEIFVVLDSIDNHVDAEDGSNNGSRDKPARIVNEPAEVEAELLTIVVRYEVERLHVVYKTFEDEAFDKAVFVFVKGLVDLIPVSVV